MAKLEILLVVVVAVLCCEAATLKELLRLDESEVEPFNKNGRMNWPLETFDEPFDELGNMKWPRADASKKKIACVDENPHWCSLFRSTCGRQSYRKYAEFVRRCRATCNMCYTL